MRISKRFVLLFFAAVFSATLQAQSSSRTQDPQSVTGMAPGWDVNPGNGLLNLRFPLPTVGGDLPIPVVLRYNASPMLQSRKFNVYDPATQTRTPETDMVGRPVHATLHFGFISAGIQYVGSYKIPQRFVLEDGSQPSFSVQGVPGGLFNLPTKFGLSSVAASTPKVTPDGSLALYTASFADLGSLGTAVTAVTPQGYSGTVDMSTFQVILDKDKARIFVFLVPLNAWVPVLWADRFGHQVSFQWTRTAGTGGQPGVDSVKAINLRNRGVLVQWTTQAISAAEIPLLQVDFIGMQAPSMTVTGFPGASDNVPNGMPNPNLADNYAVLLDSPFLACRPTKIQLGDTGMPAPPAWAAPVVGSDEKLSSSLAITWTMGGDSLHDPDYCRLAWLTEPTGVSTTFNFEVTPIPGVLDAAFAVNTIWGVKNAVSAGTGNTFTRTWTRTTPSYDPNTGGMSGNWITTLNQSFASGDPCTPPSTIYTFAGPASSREYANGALMSIAVGAGTTWSTTTYQYGPGGFGQSLSAVSKVTVDRTGEPQVVVTTVLDSFGMPSSSDTTVGGSSAQFTIYGYENHPDLLAPELPSSATVVRVSDGGAQLDAVKSLQWRDPSTLLSTGVGVQVGTQTKGTSITNDADGRAIRVDPYSAGWTPAAGGNAYQTLDYDLDGHVRSISSRAAIGSLKQDMSTTVSGLTTSVTDTSGVTTSYGYDTRGRSTSASRPGMAAVATSYTGELVRSTTQDGNTTTETYDGFGLLRSRTRTNGPAEEFSYDTAGRLTSVTEKPTTGTSRVRFTTWDPIGRPTFQSSPGKNNSFFLSYSASGRNAVTTILGGAGTTYVTKDPWGQVVSTTDVLNVTTNTTYDALGHVTKVQQGSGSPTQNPRTFSYTPLGYLQSRYEPETGTTSFSGFDFAGQPTTVIEDGTPTRSRTLSYDAFGRLTGMSNGPDSLTYSYSGAKLQWAESASAGNPVIHTDYAYLNAGGALSAEITKVNGAVLSSVKYGTDDNGHLTSLTYPSNLVVNYDWSGGQVNRVWLAGGQILRSGLQTPAGGQTLATPWFDGWGNLNEVMFASGARTTWSYNSTGSAALDTWKMYEAGSSSALETKSYTYDDNLNLNGISSTQNINGVTPDWVNLTHDAKGQLKAAQGYGLNLGFSHDDFGNNTTASATAIAPVTQVPDWLNPFSYPAPWLDNRVPSPGYTGWAVDARGEATNLRTKDGGGITLSPSWDGLGRLTGINTLVSNPAVSQAYLYSPSGMRLQVLDRVDGTRSRKYGYTSGGLLLSEAAPVQVGHRSNQCLRVYHAIAGPGAVSRNLGSFAAGDVVQVSVWFRAANGVSGAIGIHDGRAGDPSDSKKFVSMAGNGAWQQMTLNLTLSRADTLWIQLYGDMFTSTSANGTSATSVDYDDLVVQKNGVTVLQEGFESSPVLQTSDPLSTTSYYACAAGLASVQATGSDPNAWKRDVIYVAGRAIAEIDAAGIHELHTDHLGSPRVITAGSSGMVAARGHVEAHVAYGPYGELVEDPLTLPAGQTPVWTTGYLPLTGYTGHVQRDQTGLIYMRGRYYSPAWHRFLNSDQGADPNQFNQFAYVGGSPLQAIDPSGFESSADCLPGQQWDSFSGRCVYPGGGGTVVPVDGIGGWVDPFTSGPNSLAWFNLQYLPGPRATWLTAASLGIPRVPKLNLPSQQPCNKSNNENGWSPTPEFYSNVSRISTMASAGMGLIKGIVGKAAGPAGAIVSLYADNKNKEVSKSMTLLNFGVALGTSSMGAVGSGPALTYLFATDVLPNKVMTGMLDSLPPQTIEVNGVMVQNPALQNEADCIPH